MADSTKTLKTRVQLKSDTEVNWNKSVLVADGGTKTTAGNSFVPLLGELIVYTADDAHPFCRLKVGDGNTNVVALPFIDAGTINGEVIPEEQVVYYANRQLFPSPGQANKLYIDRENDTIYCYTNSSGYTKLSNFNYTVSKTSVSVITDWRVGSATSMTAKDGILNVKTGILPSLSYYNTQVVNNITKEVNNE